MLVKILVFVLVDLPKWELIRRRFNKSPNALMASSYCYLCKQSGLDSHYLKITSTRQVIWQEQLPEVAPRLKLNGKICRKHAWKTWVKVKGVKRTEWKLKRAELDGRYYIDNKSKKMRALQRRHPTAGHVQSKKRRSRLVGNINLNGVEKAINSLPHNVETLDDVVKGINSGELFGVVGNNI